MSNMLRYLWAYLQLLAREWLGLAVLFVDLLGVIIILAFPTLQVPQWVAWALGVVGVFIASFGVYRKQEKELEKYTQRIPQAPQLAIEFVEGNEYSFSLEPDRNKMAERFSEKAELEQELRTLQEQATPHTQKEADRMAALQGRILQTDTGIGRWLPTYITPDALLTLHFRISNVGKVPADILAVTPDYSGHNLPWYFIVTKINDVQGKDVDFPLHLEPMELALCNVITGISTRGTNGAQFAARLAKITYDSLHLVMAEISVEAISPTKQIATFKTTHQVAIRPLKDLYLANWQEKKRDDLVHLANAGL